MFVITDDIILDTYKEIFKIFHFSKQDKLYFLENIPEIYLDEIKKLDHKRKIKWNLLKKDKLYMNNFYMFCLSITNQYIMNTKTKPDSNIDMNSLMIDVFNIMDLDEDEQIIFYKYMPKYFINKLKQLYSVNGYQL